MKRLSIVAAIFVLAGCIDTTNPTTAPSADYTVRMRDDFTSTCATFPCDARWTAYGPGWHDTSGNGTYDCTKVCSEHDGVLDLYVHSENGVHYVAAPVPTLKAGTHSYGAGLNNGRYTVQFKSDPLPGYKLAWLLWPDDDNWPTDGEIDFPEVSLNGSTVSAFMHREGGTSGSDQDAYNTAVNATDGQWHTATVEWRPDKGFNSFYLDGKLVGASTARVPNTPMHWVLQTETQLSGGAPSSTVAGHVRIQYVEVDTTGTS